MIVESTGFIGIVRTATIDAETLKVVQAREYRNKINNYLLQTIIKWLTGTANSGSGALLPPTQIQLGNGTGTPTAADTGLWAPITGTLKTCDFIQPYQTYYGQYSLTYQTSDPSGNYTEVGLLDTSGKLWAHVSVNDYKSASQLYSVQWLIQAIGN